MGVEADLRYLCSCDAERMSDYERINRFVSAGAQAAGEIERLRAELEMLKRGCWLDGVEQIMIPAHKRAVLARALDIAGAEIFGEGPSYENDGSSDHGC